MTVSTAPVLTKDSWSLSDAKMLSYKESRDGDSNLTLSNFTTMYSVTYDLKVLVIKLKSDNIVVLPIPVNVGTVKWSV